MIARILIITILFAGVLALVQTVKAQTTTPTETPIPTTTVPSAAPATGFGPN